ncbi:DoxX family protein [Marinifilum breve]|uniref:DoxX family protein n=1 Tax=Marinifilum breve TaxID=2184082 RepID=A0A2V3ZZW1_9BACT|nr:DoxX family membrane protein [Marinifilum breve]PXY01823.1 DoxX family protein [Marinifilum breve]
MTNKDKELAFLLARVTMGINLLGHGLVRLPKLFDFKIWMLNSFQDTLLPASLVGVWASVLPFLELSIGILITAGLFTRKAIAGGAIIILILVFGSCLKENWEWVSFQMIYALYFFFLMVYIDYNQISIDNKIFKNNKL